MSNVVSSERCGRRVSDPNRSLRQVLIGLQERTFPRSRNNHPIAVLHSAERVLSGVEGIGIRIDSSNRKLMDSLKHQSEEVVSDYLRRDPRFNDGEIRKYAGGSVWEIVFPQSENLDAIPLRGLRATHDPVHFGPFGRVVRMTSACDQDVPLRPTVVLDDRGILREEVQLTFNAGGAPIRAQKGWEISFHGNGVPSQIFSYQIGANLTRYSLDRKGKIVGREYNVAEKRNYRALYFHGA